MNIKIIEYVFCFLSSKKKQVTYSISDHLIKACKDEWKLTHKKLNPLQLNFNQAHKKKKKKKKKKNHSNDHEYVSLFFP